MTSANTKRMAIKDITREQFGGIHDYLHANRELDERLTAVTRRMLTAGLAMRDAIIAAAIRPDMVDADDMTEFALHAHEQASEERMGVLLTGAFEHGDGYTPAVIERLDTLMDAVARTTAAPVAQCLAVRAYLAWWRHDTHQAMRFAVDAIGIDETCMLATIVLTALTRGVHPRAK